MIPHVFEPYYKVAKKHPQLIYDGEKYTYVTGSLGTYLCTTKNAK